MREDWRYPKNSREKTGRAETFERYKVDFMRREEQKSGRFDAVEKKQLQSIDEFSQWLHVNNWKQLSLINKWINETNPPPRQRYQLSELYQMFLKS